MSNQPAVRGVTESQRTCVQIPIIKERTVIQTGPAERRQSGSKDRLTASGILTTNGVRNA